jgi:N-acetylneuraminic acid mutarotase
VLVAGGHAAGVGGAVLASAELYDPASQAWSATGAMPVGLARHTASLLTNGTVLVAGGVGTDGRALAIAEVFDP